MMSLRHLMQEAYPGHPALPSLPEVSVKGLECDSRKIENSFVFVAVRGTRQDGGAFTQEAFRRGAVAVVTDRVPVISEKIPVILVPDSRIAAARLAAAFYGYPSKSMKVVGVTGTNGKTTSTYLVEHMLLAQRQTVGVIGTVNYRFAGRQLPAVETTPGPVRLQALLAQMREAGCRYAVMEVSAHAIDQSRVDGIHFEAALFTNLTQDHLDYFKTLDDYFECKAKLFTALSPDSFAILNADDPKAAPLRGKIRARVISFGVKNEAQIRAEILDSDLSRTRLRLHGQDGALTVQIPLAGLHNVYNALGAIGVMKALGFDLKKSAAHLSGFPGVPGRLERIDRGQNFSVFVDYAHTPDGLENVLRSLSSYKKRRLITVFGCGGDRDKGKRPQMAEIAGIFSDFVVVTSDNPRSEEPRQIADQVCSGFPERFKNHVVTLDRRKAIRQALLMARENDIVLLAGKGHETVQVIGNEALPFSDREEAERVLDGR